MKVTKDCVGIDVSKDSLECCLGSSAEDHQQTFSKVRKFKNELKGFQELLSWVESKARNDVHFVMEATGVYYENLAY